MSEHSTPKQASYITKCLERVDLLKKTIDHNLTQEKLETLSLLAKKSFELVKSGGLIITCGNGGSHATAEHLTAELNWRLDERRVLAVPSVCLGSNPSLYSAVVNDNTNQNSRFSTILFPFSKIDVPKVLVCFTTSLYSRAIINIAELAMTHPNVADMTVVFLGEDRNNTAGFIFKRPEFLVTVDSPVNEVLPIEIIQEVQTVYMHLYCDMIYSEIVEYANQERERVWKNKK